MQQHIIIVTMSESRTIHYSDAARCRRWTNYGRIDGTIASADHTGTLHRQNSAPLSTMGLVERSYDIVAGRLLYGAGRFSRALGI